MVKYIFSLVVFCAALLVISSGLRAQAVDPGAPEKPKEICITFDDLPVVRVHDRIQRLIVTDQILGTLDEFKAPAAGFVIGDQIGADADIIRQWLEAGHTLGNHTYSHPDLNTVPVDLYTADITRGAEALKPILKEYNQNLTYFRFPYLHYGTDFQTKEAVAEFLTNEKLTVVHVSIDTEDFVYNLQYEKIFESDNEIELLRLGNEYIDHIMDQVRAAEELSQEMLGRQVKHILLLHANRINAAFLADLLAELQLDGYVFITLETALTDRVYSMDESYIGPQGLSFLERLAKTDPDLLPAREQGK